MARSVKAVACWPSSFCDVYSSYSLVLIPCVVELIILGFRVYAMTVQMQSGSGFIG